MTLVPGPSVTVLSGEDRNTQNQRDGCSHADGSWYYDPFHETVSAPTVYQNLAATAVHRVWMWDPYFNDGDDRVLASLQDGVLLRLLTSGSCQMRSRLRPRLEKLVADLRTRYPRVTVQVRCFNTDNVPGRALDFHDRYLFIDDDIYIVGASMTWHRQRLGSHAVHRMEGSNARELLHGKFKHYWDHKHSALFT